MSSEHVVGSFRSSSNTYFEYDKLSWNTYSVFHSKLCNWPTFCYVDRIKINLDTFYNENLPNGIEINNLATQPKYNLFTRLLTQHLHIYSMQRPLHAKLMMNVGYLEF